MSYATVQMLTDRYGEQMLIALTDHGEIATGIVDGDTVARALTDTDGIVDGFLKARYVLPLVDVPPLVADIAQAIAIWKLHRTTPSDKIKDDYKEAMAMLDRIARGSVTLSVAGVEPDTAGGSGAVMTDRERPMTAENLTGYV